MTGWAWQVYTLQARKFLAYRSDFWVSFLMAIFGNVTLAYFLWRAIFANRGVTELNGYAFSTLMFYYLLVPLVDRIVKGPEMSFVSQEIYDGTLNRYLLYPLPFFRYKFTTFLAEATVSLFQLALAVTFFLIVFGVPQNVHLSVFSFVQGVISCLFAMLLYFLMCSLLELVAFWADTVWSLVVLSRFMIYYLGGGAIPLAFFPEWGQNILKNLPFPYLLSKPILTFMGQVPFGEWLYGLGILLAWASVFMAALMVVWRKGLKTYTGVGI
jgi:ABC-2 type transport system permease protein